MKTIVDLINLMKDDDYKGLLSGLYGSDDETICRQLTRYKNAINVFLNNFDSSSGIKLFSSPGRIELCGNHTDHNNGMVLAAGIDLDIIGVVQKNDYRRVNIMSEGFKKPFRFNISDLKYNPRDSQSLSLLKGIFSGFRKFGFKTGGINAFTSSDILKGSGISSSAAFEMLISSMLNNLYNGGSIDIIDLAKIGQYAENVYWKKPSGLLDQIACGHGGIVSIDFKDKSVPKVAKVKNIFNKNKYDVLLINTGGSHADLTKDYAAIPEEMFAAAKALKGRTLIDIKRSEFVKKVSLIRKKTGDRALLRAFHFFNENKRVKEAISAVNKNKIREFLKILKESGDSSWKYLQNCFRPSDYADQNIALALALTDDFLNGKCIYTAKIHGGGFAGVILVILPEKMTFEYSKFIEKTFGRNSVLKMKIREAGSINF